MRRLHKYYKILELDKILMMLAQKAVTQGGKEAALNLIPTHHPQKLQKELDRADDALQLIFRFGLPPFYAVLAPSPSLKHARAQGTLQIKEILNLGAVLRQARLLCDWWENCGNEHTALDSYFRHFIQNRNLENQIEHIIQSEDQISDHASETLFQIRTKLRRLSQKARESLDNTLRNSHKYLQDSLVTMRDGRYVIPVKAEHKDAIPGLVHDISSSGATVFIEPISVVQANNEIRVWQGKEREEVERILLELSGECAANGDALENNYRLIVLLDLYFAKAQFAKEMQAVKPTLSSDYSLHLKKARHPLISSDEVVPVDISLGKANQALIITGPNTGGKTVALKTLGLLTLMTECGLLLPVQEGSVIAPYARVLVDLGDEQSIEQSLSTFSAHMTNLIRILDIADESSLVLIDELGSGTDPVEGAALAVAIIESLLASGAKLAATTHYAELKAFAIQTSGVENASFLFDLKTLRPTYQLLIGEPGRSNAFAISRRLGLKEDILKRAKTFVSSEDKQFEQVIQQLQRARQEYERKVQQMENDAQQAKRLREELECAQETLDKRMEAEWEKARERAKYLVDHLQEESNILLNQLEEMKKQQEKDAVKGLYSQAKLLTGRRLRELYKEADPVENSRENTEDLPRPLRVGDQVYVYDLKGNGTVLQTPNRKGEAFVQVGSLRFWISEKKMRLLENKRITPKKSTTHVNRNSARRNVQTSLDLRGQTIQEALDSVDQFIDNCVMANIEQLTVIHGKGTGALRRAVQEHLKHHASVKEARLGTFGEGDSGVTVVTLK